MNDELLISEENEKLFYHERKPGKLVWHGSYRGMPFEIVRWEWADRVSRIASSLNQVIYNAYMFIDIEKIPAKYGPSSFWIEPELMTMPLMPEGPMTSELNKASKRLNRENVKSGRTIYRYSEHPILREIEFHGGATYYEREYQGSHRIAKIGCDWAHYCDHAFADEAPIGPHPLPITLDMVIEDMKAAIDSFLNLVPGYEEAKHE